MRKANQKKVVCAMSGGLDSSVAAALLKRAGFNVIGVFMKFWSEPNKEGLVDAWNRCCSPEAEARARKVAKILKIPFYVFNFEKEFKKRVVDYFLREYQAGQTPNPCVVCNKKIKFGLLLEKVLKLDADYIATGHYARIRKFVNHSPYSYGLGPVLVNKGGGSQQIRYSLISAKDKKKDQSYFLWQLNQKQLKHIMFPVGGYTKNEVRVLAKKFKLPVLGIPESQEICFIQTTLNDFLSRYLQQKTGKIVTIEGKIIGQYPGLAFYTIGQRKGIELPGGPFYVVAKDLKKNALIVTPFFNDKKLYSKNLIVKKVNWILCKEPKLPLKIKAQIRYGYKAVSAVITQKLKNNSYELIFRISQRAITPGQSVVFYSPFQIPPFQKKSRTWEGKGQELLGGGIICRIGISIN